MFLSNPHNPSPFKKVVYLICTTTLGILLSFIAHAIIEMTYLSWALGQGRLVTFYGGCALHPAIQITLWLAGALGGYYLGRFWWRLVYVERRWAKK